MVNWGWSDIAYRSSMQVPRVVTECQTKIVKQCTNKVVFDIKTDVRTKNVFSTTTTGGFPPCEGPITPESAWRDGVDTWACHDNCYSRKDGKGSRWRHCQKAPSTGRLKFTFCIVYCISLCIDLPLIIVGMK